MPLDRERESFTQILEVTPDFRDRLEAAVDRLLDILDAIDAPDEDLEEDEHDGREKEEAI